jgi:hypothetical protein
LYAFLNLYWWGVGKRAFGGWFFVFFFENGRNWGEFRGSWPRGIVWGFGVRRVLKGYGFECLNKIGGLGLGQMSRLVGS